MKTKLKGNLSSHLMPHVYLRSRDVIKVPWCQNNCFWRIPSECIVQHFKEMNILFIVHQVYKCIFKSL